MIRFFIYVFVTILTFQQGFSQEKWYNQNYPSDVGYNCVFFFDANNGWICGNNGTILSTSDGGKNWEQQNSGFNGKLCNLTGICFTDTKNGWCVGEYSFGIRHCILHTTDGGTSWNTVTLNYTDGILFYGVCFKDKLHGWLIGDNGQTFDDDAGIIVKTSDGGNSWFITILTVTLPNGTYKLQSGSFPDLNNGWAVGWFGRILHTTDGGSSWDLQNKTDQSGNNRYGVSFVDNLNGWVVGIRSILHTSTGGNSWNPQDPGTQTPLNGVFFKDKNTGWVAGGHDLYEKCIILKTTNGGTDWLKQTIDDTTRPPKSVFITKGNVGWAVGYGVILSTLTPTRFPYDTTGMSGTDETIATNGHVKIQASGKPTICEGESIVLSAYPTGSQYSYSWSTGESTQNITVSKSGTYQVVVQNTAGIKDSISMNVTVNTKPIVNISPGKIVTLCSGDKVDLIADGDYAGYSWSNDEMGKKITVKEAGHYELTVTDTAGCTNVFAVDVTIKDLLLAVSPMKVNCGKIPINRDTVFSIYFANQGQENMTVDSFYVVSDKSIFSRDGNVTFPIVIKPTEQYQAKVKFSPKKALTQYFDSVLIKISEPCQKMYKIDVSGIGDKANEIGENDARINYFEIFPNPVNNSSLVCYEIANSGYVKITIENMLGEAVMPLLDSYQDTGINKLSFNVENLNPGIYFLKFRTERLTEVRKFIVTK